MREPLTPLDWEPVSVHTPFLCYPDGQYRYEDPKQRRAALRAALHGVPLSADDQHILHWLAGWEVSTVVSLLGRTPHTAAGQDCRGEGEPR